MIDHIIFESIPHGERWHVRRDGKLVTQYSLQRIAERAASRLARTAARKGGSVQTIFRRQDGSIRAEHFYGGAKSH